MKHEFNFHCEIKSLKPDRIQLVTNPNQFNDDSGKAVKLFEFESKILKPVISDIEDLNADELELVVEKRNLYFGVTCVIDYSQDLGEAEPSHPSVGGVRGNMTRDVLGHDSSIQSLEIILYEDDNELLTLDVDGKEFPELEEWINDKIPSL